MQAIPVFAFCGSLSCFGLSVTLFLVGRVEQIGIKQPVRSMDVKDVEGRKGLECRAVRLPGFTNVASVVRLR